MLDDLNNDNSIHFDKIKMIAEYRCINASAIIKIRKNEYESDLFLTKLLLLNYLLMGSHYFYNLFREYSHVVDGTLFSSNFFVYTLFVLICPLITLLVTYSGMKRSKKNLDFAITGYNDWKWILDKTKLPIDSKEMDKLQEKFWVCNSAYKFVHDRNDEQVINELV